MKNKTIIFALFAGCLASGPALAAPSDGYVARQGDRVARHLERQGNRINHRLDRRSAKASTNGYLHRARRLDRTGNRINRHLDRQARHVDRSTDRFTRRHH